MKPRSRLMINNDNLRNWWETSRLVAVSQGAWVTCGRIKSDTLKHSTISTRAMRVLFSWEPASRRLHLINRGAYAMASGSLRGAREAFTQAYSIASSARRSNKGMLARLALLNAQMLLSERRFAAAKVEGRKALSLNAENEHAVEAKCVVGLATVLSGAAREGKVICDEAVEMATSMTFQPLLPEAQLAQAQAMIEGGDIPGRVKTARLAQRVSHAPVNRV